ncbi:9934_t:CDS:2 [Paraglomus occultum]|uniref:9934_t:CDS:1 n=1 Tax=Paraglomus occultum TaxID=144539 RepID=A0A9N9FXA8_9GLOM|nr:9934_t:CDS:2 [Paraglomus occultum]
MNKQTAGMLGLKINVKLNGSNMALHSGSLPFIEEKPTIVFGADVSHPGPGSDMPSIAAIVASYDQNVTKYATSIRFQKSRVEIIESIEEMVIELLRIFHRTTKRKPQRILFYRDGVGEGQYEDIVHYEVEGIRNACRKLEATYNPTITFIVVRKRHHTRMFPVNRSDVDNKSNNCQAGTVLERPVGHPFEFDFFLLSHPGLQGTSRPTHYHVLVDDNKFDADRLQTLTYNLCYLFARCPRAVSMVSPAYYAHLAAFRARFWRKNSILSDSASVSTDTGLGIEDYKQMHPKMKSLMFFM